MALGKKKVAEVKRDAEISVAVNEKDANIQVRAAADAAAGGADRGGGGGGGAAAGGGGAGAAVGGGGAASDESFEDPSCISAGANKSHTNDNENASS